MSICKGLLAGPAALERYAYGEYVSEFDPSSMTAEPEDPIWRAVALLSRLSAEPFSLIRDLWREIMTEYADKHTWTKVEAVADALILNRELAGSEVDEITQANS